MNTMNIGERIKSIRNESGLSLEKFGTQIGISKSSLSYLERGINNPSPRTIKVICSEFGINEDCLVNGKGEMYLSVQDVSSYSEQDREYIEMYLSLPKDQKDWLRSLMDRLVIANKAERE